MSILDWLAPETAEAMHLRSISKTLAGRARTSRQEARSQKRAVELLEEDTGVLALVLLSLVTRLVEKGIVTRDELFSHFEKLDALDGVKDGKLDLDVLRGSLGLAREEKPVEAPRPTAPKRGRH